MVTGLYGIIKSAPMVAGGSGSSGGEALDDRTASGNKGEKSRGSQRIGGVLGEVGDCRSSADRRREAVVVVGEEGRGRRLSGSLVQINRCR